ncbi:MAG: polysaccharide deacetylase family protein [Candidatus Omnitrophota bacterium]|nr:polysaccharide deacetylase family protein [Candidatus Omnitrophota bacterium]
MIPKFIKRSWVSARQAVSCRVLAKRVNVNLAEPLVTFTFDDVPVSAFDAAAPILEKHHFKGTFYVSGALAESTAGFMGRQQIRSLIKRGHEIGCHTYSHVRTGFSTRARLEADLRRNADYFEENFAAYRLSSFAYPFGSIGLWNKPVLAKRFHSARGNAPGINLGATDLYTLASHRLYSNFMSPEFADRIIRDAIEKKAWLIFYTHDVLESPTPYGCTPALFTHVVKAVSDSGVRVVTMKEGTDFISPLRSR